MPDLNEQQPSSGLGSPENISIPLPRTVKVSFPKLMDISLPLTYQYRNVCGLSSYFVFSISAVILVSIFLLWAISAYYCYIAPTVSGEMFDTIKMWSIVLFWPPFAILYMLDMTRRWLFYSVSDGASLVITSVGFIDKRMMRDIIPWENVEKISVYYNIVGYSVAGLNIDLFEPCVLDDRFANILAGFFVPSGEVKKIVIPTGGLGIDPRILHNIFVSKSDRLETKHFQ